MPFAIAAAIAVASPMSATALAQAPAAQPDAAAKQSALALVRFLHPVDVQLAMADRMVDVSIGPAFRNNPDFTELEAEFPGILDAVLDSLRPIMRDYVRQGLPEYYDRVANLYASRLTAAEIDDLAGFYRTPTGKKMVKAMTDNYKIDASMAEVVADPDAPTSLSAVTEDHQAAVASARATIDASDSEALITLGKKPYAKKVLELGLAMRKLDQEVMNEPDPALDKKVEEAVGAVIERYMGSAVAKAAAK